jgi:inorganic pyrophosphatase/exopolyphosphatase
MVGWSTSSILELCTGLDTMPVCCVGCSCFTLLSVFFTCTDALSFLLLMQRETQNLFLSYYIIHTLFLKSV